MNDIEEIMESVYEEVVRLSHEEGIMRRDAFTNHLMDMLTESQVVDNYDLADWYDPRIGAKLDAFEVNDDYITLVSTIWVEPEKGKVPSVPDSKIKKEAKRVMKFFQLSLNGKLKTRLDESNPALNVSEDIFEKRHDIDSIRIIILTNGVVRNQNIRDSVEQGVNILWEIWDAERIKSYKLNKEKRGASIDFESYESGPIETVRFDTKSQSYTTYLGFVPGVVLADMYRRHKTRLLEKNVRVFLSQRVNVNKGIRDTIRFTPDLFCAYNNGITVIAENITLQEVDGRVFLKKVEDFQIVNGGQTTASLHHTRKKYASDLSNINVQMKLMVISDEAMDNSGKERLADTLVPKIGRYSNTQNRIRMSDLNANDYPHPELHKISLNTPVKGPEGGALMSYWFYENSRGKWDELKRHEDTQAKRKTYESKYPRSQRFEKGKMAKVWYSFYKKPHEVAKGPQKCFAAFQANELSNLPKDEDLESFFRKTIAKMIIWNSMEKEVRQRTRRGEYQKFTQNIVAYALSMFSFKNPDFNYYDYIWEKQCLDDDFFEYLMNIADKTHNHITDLPGNFSLVPEYCKKEVCWDNFKKNSSRIKKLPNHIVSKIGARYTSLKSSEDSNLYSEEIKYCLDISVRGWRSMVQMFNFYNVHNTKEYSQLENMAKTVDQGKIPSRTLAEICSQLHKNAMSDDKFKDWWKILV